MKVPVFPDPILTQYLTDLAKEQEETGRDYLTKSSANHSLLLQSPSNSIYEVLVNDLGVVNTNLVLFSTGTPSTGLAVTESRDTAAFFGTIPNAPGLHWNYLSGLTLSTPGVIAFTVAPGVAVDSTNADLMRLTAAISKITTGAWAAGSGSGGLDTGSIASSTWYHVFLIKRLDTGVVDVVFSLSATSPTLPANYRLFRRIGSMATTGSGTWTKFIQDGDSFMWTTPFLNVSVSNPGTTAVTRALSVPVGIRVGAKITAGIISVVSADGISAYVSDLLLDDVVSAITNAATVEAYISIGVSVNYAGVGSGEVMTNTLGQVRTRVQASSVNVNFYILTNGYTDRRGRDG